MELTKQALNELKGICLKKSGELLTDEQANELGSDLLRYFQLIYRPISKNYMAMYAKR